MRILLMARETGIIGGVQSWMETVRSVTGADIHTPDDPPEGRYEVGIFAHWHDFEHYRGTNRWLGHCERVVNVSHGICRPEKPGPGIVACVSEEVAEHWQVDAPIVRQPITLDEGEYDPEGPVMLFSQRHGVAHLVRDAARQMGRDFEHVHDNPRPHGRLRRASCVVASGRALLEAMAMGIPSVLCDQRRNGSWRLLMHRHPRHAMRANYSGRNGESATVEGLVELIEAAEPNAGHIAEHHDPADIVERLCSL